MKNIKRVLIALLLILGFIMQSEIFQIECITFRTGYYLSSIFSYKDEEERVNFLNELSNVAESKNVEIFTTKIETVNMLDNKLTIYGNVFVNEEISRNHGIEEKTYESLLSGSIKVEYRDFIELSAYENRFINYISFIGEKQDIYDLYYELYEKYELEYPCLMGSNEKDMIFIVWVAIIAALILFTCIEIIYSKKEAVLRMLMGHDLKKYILKNMITEVFIDIMMFILIHTIVFSLISGEFMKTEAAVIYGIGVLISALSYMTYYIFDVKKVLTNVNDSKGILYFTYFIKAIVTILSMLVLVTNLSVITGNTLGLTTDEIIDKCTGYYFVSIKDEAISFYYNYDEVKNRFKEKEKILEEMFFNYYDEVQPLICTLIMEENGKKYVCANEYATILLNDFIGNENISDADAVIFIPKQYKDENVYDNAVLCLTELVNNADECKIERVYYSNKYLTYFDMNATYGVNTVFEPIVIYSKRSNGNIKIPTTNSILYKVSDRIISELEDKYQLNENGYKINKTDLETFMNYNSNVVKKIIVFCSSICSIMLIIQIFLITTINAMEYQRNAMELTIKKLLGYGVAERHKKIFINIAVYYVSAIIISGVAGYIMGGLRIGTCIGVGIFMMLLDISAALINILKLENRNINKILKGEFLW